MKRRALLATGGLSLAGCVGSLPSIGASTRREVDLESVDAVPDRFELTVAVEVLKSTVNDDHPARVRVTTTNDGDARLVSVGRDDCDVFNRARGRSDPRGLWLYRPGVADGLTREDDLWTEVDHGPREYATYGCLATEYDRGESITTEYEVWDDYRTGGYYPPGTYRFSARVAVGPAPRNGRGRGIEDGESFEWGFTLRVERD